MPLERDDFLEPINKVESVITPLNRDQRRYGSNYFKRISKAY